MLGVNISCLHAQADASFNEKDLVHRCGSLLDDLKDKTEVSQAWIEKMHKRHIIENPHLERKDARPAAKPGAKRGRDTA